MVRLVARKRMTYDHRQMKAGEEFEVENDLHARVLVVRRRAKPATRPKFGMPKARKPAAPAAADDATATAEWPLLPRTPEP